MTQKEKCKALSKKLNREIWDEYEKWVRSFVDLYLELEEKAKQAKIDVIKK